MLMNIVRAFRSVDGITTKYVLSTGDALIECTHVDRAEKHIICFSTAVGCPIRCGFCAATAFKRRLSAEEMCAQALAVLHVAIGPTPEKPVLFSAMGEGEPLLSFGAAEALVNAFRHLTATFATARAALSTTAIKPALIPWLSDSAPPRLKLQISLHGSTDAQRRMIVPRAARLSDVVLAGQDFHLRRPGWLEWNYVLIHGLNDSLDDARRLGEILRAGQKVKLNRLNSVPGVSWRASERSDRFAELLNNLGLVPEFYATDGTDVAAACGQLKSRVARANSEYCERSNDARVFP
jgi:23S rRNA (adenine2503-C2)-methyltransferase